MWQRIFAKIKLKVMGPESTMVCKDDQIYDRLKALIDRATHGVQALWDKKLSTEEYIF